MTERDLAGLIRSVVHGRSFDLWNATVTRSEFTDAGLVLSMRSLVGASSKRRVFDSEEFEITIKKKGGA